MAVVRQTKDELGEEPEKEEDFVLVDFNEEEILRECWKKLPFAISFEDFRQRIRIVDKRGCMDRLYIFAAGCFWTLQLGCSVSGYVTTLWTAAQYTRAAHQFLQSW
jgi:hypothetical protein